MGRKFYGSAAKEVAKELLSKVLVHETADGITEVMIVEPEAYYGELAPASHFPRILRTRKEPGTSLIDSNLRIEEATKTVGSKFALVSCPRVGVKDTQKIRFHIEWNQFVSKR